MAGCLRWISWGKTGWLSTSLGLIVLGMYFGGSPALASSCTLSKIAEFPITMTNLRPLMTAKINDTEVRFLVDSGSFFSIISPGNAAELKLHTYPAPFGFYMTGVGGGTASASVTKVKVFTLAGVPLHDIEFLVGGSEAGGGFVLGQNVLHLGDVEYDLGQSVIRLLKARDCNKAGLAYWTGTSLPFSVISIESTTSQKPFAMGSAFVNGKEIRVMFDTGAGVSTLSLKAAARVGIKPDSPGVVSGGSIWGFGKITIPSYIAPFASFKIGDEEVKNTRLRIADIDLPEADMLIGPDFFVSHRIYVANSQHKLYFTYNGGPVFNLSAANHAAARTAPTDTASADSSAVATAAATAPPAANPPDGVSDAAEYSRRGAVFASRHDFEQALAAFTRACELAPDDAECFDERAHVYLQLRQAGPAKADFDQALKLKPNDLSALVSRAQLSIQQGDTSSAGADLGTADSVAAKQSDIRFAMAGAYEGAGNARSAILQYDLWISAHPDDARIPTALNSRCRARALEGVDLSLALKDCNAALGRADKSSAFYGRISHSRGLVRLRMGDYDKSIADYDVSLKIDPKDAWSWYGRGVDKLRQKKTAEGDADIAQARALAPKIADEFRNYGIVP